MHRTRYEQLEASARAFHREHPEVWLYFCQFTFELIERGFRQYSAQHGVFARIRWETDVADAKGGSSFKVNNNHSAFYARWFMAAYPEYAGFYRTRAQTSRQVPASDWAELGPEDVDRPVVEPRLTWRPRRPLPVPEAARRRWEECVQLAA